MASKVPPNDAAQPKTLAALHEKLLRKRLAVWGVVTATSVVVAIGALLIAPGSHGTRTAASGAVPELPVAAAVPMPPAELRVLKQASDALQQATEQATHRLANVERNTEATRAATNRLAEQVNKLSADSFRFTGRLANIERQIDGMTGSIKSEARKAVAEAVAKTMPTKPGYSTFGTPAPIISPPATTAPKLSLLVPVSQTGKGDDLTTAAIKTPDAKADPKSGSDSMAEAELKAGGHKSAEPKPSAGDVKAEVGIQSKKGAIARPRKELTSAEKAQIVAREAMANRAMAEKSMAAAEKAKTEKSPTRVARAEPTRRHTSHYDTSERTSFGVDLGGADSLTVAKAQWAAVKANFGPILGRLRPIAVRNHRVMVSGTYRLIAAHLRSWAAAKSVCERLARGDLACQPVKFQGNRIFWQ